MLRSRFSLLGAAMYLTSVRVGDEGSSVGRAGCVIRWVRGCGSTYREGERERCSGSLGIGAFVVYSSNACVLLLL